MNVPKKITISYIMIFPPREFTSSVTGSDASVASAGILSPVLGNFFVEERVFLLEGVTFFLLICFDERCMTKSKRSYFVTMPLLRRAQVRSTQKLKSLLLLGGSGPSLSILAALARCFPYRKLFQIKLGFDLMPSSEIRRNVLAWRHSPMRAAACATASGSLKSST